MCWPVATVLEMRTGEGKTLTGAVAALVRALDARTPEGVPVRAARRAVVDPERDAGPGRPPRVRRIADRLGVTTDLVTAQRLRRNKQQALPGRQS